MPQDKDRKENQQQNGEKKSTGGGISFGFKKTSTPTAKRKETQDDREYVTGISEKGVESLHPTFQEGPLVIPMPERKPVKIPKRYENLIKGRTGNTENIDPDTKPMEVDTQQDSKTGTANVQSSATTQNDNQTKSLEDQAIEELMKEAKGERTTETEGEEITLPLLLQTRNPDLDDIEDEEQKFKMDVASRPEEPSLDAYEKIPVEAFGIALLRGMDWKEGTPIGKTNPMVVQPFEFVQRPGYRSGLGAQVEMPPELQKKKKYIKPGESREDSQPKVLLPGADGQVRHRKNLDEELVPISKTGIRPGSLVGIVAGKHDGLYARVIRLIELGTEVPQAVVKLESSEEEVKVNKADLHLIEERHFEQHKEQFISKVQDNRQSSNGESDKKSKKKEKTKDKESDKKTWLRTGLVVRIVSKSVGNGSYYLKKGTVLDVIAGDRAEVQLLDSNKLVEVKQRMVETVIPKAGDEVMIVLGEHAGTVGKFMSKTREKDEAVAVVQLSSDFSVQTFELDAICQYTKKVLM